MLNANARNKNYSCYNEQSFVNTCRKNKEYEVLCTL